MAEKDPTNLMQYDFLGDVNQYVNTPTGGNIWEKQAALYRQDAMAGVVRANQISAILQPMVTQQKIAKEARRQELIAYANASPEIDDSLLYEGISDIATDIMKSDGMSYREITRQLAGMNPMHPDYDVLTKQLNTINEKAGQLQRDNDKLLSIRNSITADTIDEWSDGMTEDEDSMYTDIKLGNSENFQNVDGKLAWVNPNVENATPIFLKDINAEGPTFKNNVSLETHHTLRNAVVGSKSYDPVQMNYKIGTFFNSVGNNGVKSLIFDGEGDNGMDFNTSEWFSRWYADNNITDPEAQLQEYNRIKREGVTTFGADGITSVKDHFAKWYEGEFSSIKGMNVAPEEKETGESGFKPLTITGNAKLKYTGSDGKTQYFPHETLNNVGNALTNREDVPLSGGKTLKWDGNTYKLDGRPISKQGIFGMVLGSNPNRFPSALLNSGMYLSIPDWNTQAASNTPVGVLAPGMTYNSKGEIVEVKSF